MIRVIDDQVEEFDEMSGLELWLSDLSTDSATRNLGAFLLGIGGALGIIIGIMLISGNVSDILSGQMEESGGCLLYTSPSPRDATLSRMPSSA